MARQRAAPIQISESIIPDTQLVNVNVVPRDLYMQMQDDKQWLQWLASHRLIRNAIDCSVCHIPMALMSCKNSNDKFSWRCRNCCNRISVRTGSFFADCQLPTQKVVMLMYYWVCEIKAKHVMYFESLSHWSTIVNYNKHFRTECQNWSLRSNQQLGGMDIKGESLFIEVDENYFFRSKHHRKNDRSGQCVVGLVERDSGRCWLEMVENPDASTLECIICDHVLPGTTIVTDDWQGYNNIGQLKHGVYKHLVYANEFVDSLHPDTHIKTIEDLWMQIKKKLGWQGGTSRGLFPGYFAEFQWRNSHKENVFGTYLQLLYENYNI
jgi:hypothetical protein